MSDKPTLYIVAIAFALAAIILFFKSSNDEKFASPIAKVFNIKGVSVSSPVPSPSPKLKTFQFDASTDLKLELDSVNPEVMDSDFE